MKVLNFLVYCNVSQAKQRKSSKEVGKGGTNDRKIVHGTTLLNPQTHWRV